jgi:hypothetical protein
VVDAAAAHQAENNSVGHVETLLRRSSLLYEVGVRAFATRAPARSLAPAPDSREIGRLFRKISLSIGGFVGELT